MYNFFEFYNYHLYVENMFMPQYLGSELNNLIYKFKNPFKILNFIGIIYVNLYNKVDYHKLFSYIDYYLIILFTFSSHTSNSICFVIYHDLALSLKLKI